MILCFMMYGILLVLLIRKKLPRKIWMLVFLCTTVSLGVFLLEGAGSQKTEIKRNSYGGGSRVESFQVEISGSAGKEAIEIEVEERQLTKEQIEKMFQEILEKMDGIILGNNESFDRVEQDLNLVTFLEDYPVNIEWELDSYKVINQDGTLRKDKLEEAGTLVELRGCISYGNEQVMYLRNAKIYPVTLEGKELLLSEIKKSVQKREADTREEETFILPEEVSGKTLSWSGEKSTNGYYVLFLGIMAAAFLIYREKDKRKREEEKRRAQLRREYPGMVAKMNMLISTGMTVKAAWEKIVQQYEAQKEDMGQQLVYEEMSLTVREMKGGVPEGEAYERFGKRCELTIYLKFGALLSQNLRKGSRGISEVLRVEAIQSFEDRKNLAKKMGEEAGTKLLVPMMGMLAVVMIMIMVPAVMTMQF